MQQQNCEIIDDGPQHSVEAAYCDSHDPPSISDGCSATERLLSHACASANPAIQEMGSSSNLRRDGALAATASHDQPKSITISEKDKGDQNAREWKLVPPDGGWGWLVLFGSTLVNVLVPGTVKSFGVLFVEFLEAFDASPAAAAWIPALCYFLYSSLGPVSSILSVKYSYRTVTLIGGTFASVGMMVSFFANSVHYLCFSYGVLVGIGAGLSFPPTVYIVTNYFVKLRGLANGLCISGSALGSMILPPLLRVLLQLYGYRGAVLLMGAITLNVWVAALFYDPVEKHMKRVYTSIDQSIIMNDHNTQDTATTNANAPQQTPTSGDIDASPVLSPIMKFTRHESSSAISDANNPLLTAPGAASCAVTYVYENKFNRSLSSAAVPTLKCVTMTPTHDGRERKVSAPLRIRNTSSPIEPADEGSLAGTHMTRRHPISQPKRTPKRSPSTSSFQYISTPYHGSTLTLQPEMFASSFSLRFASPKSGSSEAVDRLDSAVDRTGLATSSALSKTADTKKKSSFSKFFDLDLLKNPKYLIILISNATNAVSYTNFIILLPSYALSLSFDKTMGALLLSIVSAFDLVGRIGGSALSDLQWCPKAAYFVGGLLVSGVSLTIMPLFSSYSMVAACCAVFGLASGAYVGVTAVIMADMLGEHRLQSSYGISLFVNGIIQLIGPPLCGVWFEHFRSYAWLFSTLGLVLIMGASLWLFMPCLPSSADTPSFESTTALESSLILADDSDKRLCQNEDDDLDENSKITGSPIVIRIRTG